MKRQQRDREKIPQQKERCDQRYSGLCLRNHSEILGQEQRCSGWRARPPGEFYNWRTLGNMRYLNTSINISHRSWCPSTGLELELGGRWIKHWILTKCLVLTLKLSHIQIPSHKADPKSCFLFSPLIRENEPSQLISHWITVLSSHPSPGSSWGKFIL